MTLNDLKLDKWTGILQLVNKYDTVTELCKSTGMTNSHTIGIIQFFVKYKLVNIRQEGRKKIITLTDRGMTMNQLIRKIKELLK